MKKFVLSRDAWLALALFFVLTIVTVMAVTQETRAASVTPAYTSYSTAPNGVQALRDWLNALDYSVSNKASDVFTIPPETNLMLLLEPRYLLTSSDWELIDKWVNDGGTLLLVGQRFGTLVALEHYPITVMSYTIPTTTLTVETPFLDGPALPNPLPFTTPFYLDVDQDDFVTLLANNGRPATITFPQGKGRVIISTLIDPLTNVGLQNEGSAVWVLNLLSLAGASHHVWFDDWHHGFRSSVAVNNGNWLFHTPGGQSFLLLGVILFVTIALRGRRFGRPVPLPKDLSRRTPLEYITAMANLNRRAGHKTAVLQDTHSRLKRYLGHRHRLNPTLPDDEFVTQLLTYDPTIDGDALRRLLRRLSRPDVNETELVTLASEAAKWQQKL